MSYIENLTFDELKSVDSAHIERTCTFKDIELFSIMSGDVNPEHVDAKYAKNDGYHPIIAQGMWWAALISTVLGTTLPAILTRRASDNMTRLAFSAMALVYVRGKEK